MSITGSVVTLSAAFGSGGAHIGRLVAERLGLPFLDRAIPLRVAAELGVPPEHAGAHDEQVQGWFTRWFASAAPLARDYLVGPDAPRLETLSETEFLARTQRVLRSTVAEGGAVIVGRAGALVLADCPTALHVRLDGDRDLRARQAAALGSIPIDEASAMTDKYDRMHASYTRRFYSADPTDASHYHVILDSTRLSFSTCADLIVTATRARISS